MCFSKYLFISHLAYKHLISFCKSFPFFDLLQPTFYRLITVWNRRQLFIIKRCHFNWCILWCRRVAILLLAECSCTKSALDHVASHFDVHSTEVDERKGDMIISSSLYTSCHAWLNLPRLPKYGQICPYMVILPRFTRMRTVNKIGAISTFQKSAPKMNRYNNNNNGNVLEECLHTHSRSQCVTTMGMFWRNVYTHTAGVNV